MKNENNLLIKYLKLIGGTHNIFCILLLQSQLQFQHTFFIFQSNRVELSSSPSRRMSVQWFFQEVSKYWIEWEYSYSWSFHVYLSLPVANKFIVVLKRIIIRSKYFLNSWISTDVSSFLTLHKLYLHVYGKLKLSEYIWQILIASLTIFIMWTANSSNLRWWSHRNWNV